MRKTLKLTAELVPSSCWYRNLRSAVPRPVWDRIRRSVYAQYKHRCGACGERGRLNCHDIWEYDEQTHIQRLTGLIALCDLCHHVKHLFHTGGLAAEGKLDYELVVQHFMRVNGCDRREFEAHREQAFELYDERSQHEWRVEWGEYERLVTHQEVSEGL